MRELLALALDIGTNLGRVTARSARSAARDRLARAAVDLGLGGHYRVGSFAAGVVPDWSVCLIALPSSIAISGTGGEPACIAR